MAFLKVNNVRVCGVSACVPKLVEENAAIYAKWGDFSSFVGTTGIERRHISSPEVCSSDLCVSSAEKLIAELGWEKESIDAIVFVSQTPDYILPATSPILQDKLGLSEECYTLDISLGCSGWVYALCTLATLMQNGSVKRGLVLAGETPSKICSPEDKSTWPLFGDAGTATAIEYAEDASPILFHMCADGSGKDTIIINDGGYRNQTTTESFALEEHGEGVKRNKLHVELDGMSVFSFGISKAPKSVKKLLENFEIDKDSVDKFVFHQANLFMNEKIRKKLKLEEEKVPYCLKDFGNTSCASIPLTLVSQNREELKSKKLNIIGCGFGVGLSWGSVYFETDKIVCPELVEL